MTLCQMALIILVLPLLAFLIQVFLGRRLPRQGDWVPTLAMGIALLMSLKMVVVDLLGPEGGITPQRWVVPWMGENWLSTGGGSFTVDFGILVDNLTIVMLLVVTLVSFLVHLYSWGYMKGEKYYGRFFAYLALFSFSMLGLIISSNLLFVFIFWELVGLCSYFLIGFYFDKKSASNAAIKAFLTTRIGDVGFLLGIMIIFAQVGSMEFDVIFESVRQFGQNAADSNWTMGLLAFAGICIFAGAAGKSAQFPLHIWLPDAMEGPTPVSALIHAATMVAAGVYLVARMFPFLAGGAYFDGNFLDSIPLDTVAMVGGFTAFFAATIAFSQTDIKKVLAYSTVSQLGYMMLALGVGSVSAGLFHLTTHAFFKALLFLGAGSVIHAVHSNELKDMGGLRKKMPITWITFLVGTLAISGLPFLSGFYSKEAILTQAMGVAHVKGGLHWLPFIFGMLTAVMTTFYMFRLFIKTFHGGPRNQHAHEHAHESPWTMTVPLVVLAVFAVCGGGYGLIKKENLKWFEHRVSSQTMAMTFHEGEDFEVGTYVLSKEALSTGPFHEMEVAVDESHGIVLILSLVAFLAGLGGAMLFFATRTFSRRQLVQPGTFLGGLNRCLLNLWYVDWFLMTIFVGMVHFFRHLCNFFDKYVVDGLVNLQGYLCRFVAWVVGLADHWGVDGTVRGIGHVTLLGGRKARKLQTGYLGQYIYTSVFLMAGVLVISLWMIWVTKK